MKPKILVPIDFSDCTDNVLGRALELAGELSAEVVLMHSVLLPRGLDRAELRPDEDGEPRPALSYLADDARARLAELAEELLARGVEVKQVVTVGPPAEQIARLAGQERASRIVMGTHGRRGLSRLVLGSVAEAVARDASCPVDLVQSEWSPSCQAGSCAWCGSGRTRAAQQIEAERDG